jgi:imidazolonepropionase-like amidohydrolase
VRYLNRFCIHAAGEGWTARWFAWLLFVGMPAVAQEVDTAYTNVTLIKNVTVIDATGRPAQAGLNLLIELGHITAITKDPISAQATVEIDGTGKFLIPGLWDMHVHWYDENYLPLFLANGVTGVRQMWGVPLHYYWKARVNIEAFLSPRMLVASPIIDGPQPIWPGSIAVGDEAHARRAVRRTHEWGADFIKVYSRLPAEEYFAIVDESKILGIPFAGHVPMSVTAEQASDAGQKSFEHLSGIPIALSAERESIEDMQRNASSIADYAAIQKRVTDTYDPTRGPTLYQKLKQNETWQSPTLTVLRNLAYARQRITLDQERLQYLPRTITDTWLPSANPRFRDMSDEGWQSLQRGFDNAKHMVGEMNKVGVPIIAGTDVLNPYCFPGFSLHDELQLLVESGLTPMEALQAATRNAAEFSERLGLLGTIEIGKIADLVLLAANPLEDIRNTTEIDTVIFNGRVYKRDDLDAMLEKAKEIAAHQNEG